MHKVVAVETFQRRTVEERVQTTHQKMDSAFKLDKAKLTQVDSIFAIYYRATDKIEGRTDGRRRRSLSYA